ncbi:TOMM precursor leader peptide-binding protein [Gottfriedia acidiceleris]|uniref:TOMM precursor leader peptide-binding protein n=1 Tax=Bacillaceae TaxID=186817 RepID=UPI000BED7AF8|nr:MULTISPECIES: TOMM precursor leader peptide-binding protein [unclassified Bacillus (in: firmicutes)]PEC51870.1 bacteriocin biosynthesis protein SagD [Bacillus sp. AFS096315]PFM79048.1 bacteriocin biosynthesis protein SagD [Bacillus sp. AFS077874]
MNSTVTIFGEGLLSKYTSEILLNKYKIVQQKDLKSPVSEDTSLILILDDAWNPKIYEKADEILRIGNVPWLRACISFGEGVIGPLVHPGQKGCIKCADFRRLMAGRERREMLEIDHQLFEGDGVSDDVWGTRTGLLQMAYLIAAEVEKFMNGKETRLEERIFLLNMKTFKSSNHFFLPYPLCPICGELEDDTSDSAIISLEPSMKVSPTSYRSRSMDELKKVLVNDYLGQKTGFLNGKAYDLTTPFADVVVNLPLLQGDEGTAGRTLSYESSELTAILEGLERYCGLTPRGKKTVVHDSYNNVKEYAMNPEIVGTHSKEQYALPRFPFKKFNPKRKIDWVWGYSFLKEEPILVPELLSYYSLGCGHGYVYETSNGCALGGSLEEAIFYGILEIVERDSFLMTWYAQLALPRLDPKSAKDQELDLMIERMRLVGGYDLHLFNSTMENGIPSIVAIAKNRKEHGLNLICAAGAHLDPVRAVKSAVHELAGMMLTLDKKFEENYAKNMKMLLDNTLVKQMDDHGMLYGLPQAEERLKFLLDDNRPLKTFEEEFKWNTNHLDLTNDLKDILQVFKQLKLDVIVVDQTTPEIKRNGLSCVKVLIPGMLPMTFGNHLKRLNGLDRVLKVPVKLGYTKKPLKPEQLNPYPHPFP